MRVKVELNLIPSADLPGAGSFGAYSYRCVLCDVKSDKPGKSHIVNVFGREQVVCVCGDCIKKYQNKG